MRGLRRQPGYTALNVGGLALGIACCLLIAFYVRHEWSHDRFHEHADRLYRMTYENRQGEDLPPAAPDEFQAWSTAAIAPLLETEFPEVEHAVRLSGRHTMLFTRGEEAFQEERYFFADPEFFEVFTFPLLQGDPTTALVEPTSVVLAESAARRYFGDDALAANQVLGQALQLGSGDDVDPLVVTGIMADVPATSHLDFDILLSMSLFENGVRANDRGFVFDSWNYVDFFTYVLLDENASGEAFQAKMPAFVQRHHGEAMREWPQSYTLRWEPITEAYFSPTGGFAAGPRGNSTYLYLFGFIGLFILLIACVNFMNLATARATKRAKEVGVRKSVGANRSSLVRQFLAEALFLATAAAILGVVLAESLLPFFQELAGKEIAGGVLTSPPVAGALMLGTILVGLLAGSYPAAVLSAFRPAAVLKGAFATSRRGQALRKGLVVGQFTIAIVLIVGTLVVGQQLRYLQSEALGFDDQQLIVDFGHDDLVTENMDAVKQALAALPVVEQVSATRSVPGDFFPDAGTSVEDPLGTMRGMDFGLYEVDATFLTQLGVGVAAGRLFSPDFETDAEEALILNEAATRALGYADPAEAVGKPFDQWGRTGTVVGIVQDFHHESLHHEVRPLSFRVSPWVGQFVLQVDAAHAEEAVALVEAAWATIAPHRPFLYRFLDDAFDAQYRAEERFGVLFGTFAALAIIVACLGLFGLAAYAAQQRTKEIGVRKVLGAGVPGLVGLLARDFVRLVLIGTVVAAPLAYLAMDRWLDAFAYRIDIGVGVFLTAGGLAFAIALLTVGGHALRAATTDPVKALRYE
ncbi:MAG: ABC transporter permease [Bacteroidota bacterium]